MELLSTNNAEELRTETVSVRGKLRPGEAIGAPEFDEVFDKLVRIVETIGNRDLKPWETRWTWSSWTGDPSNRSNLTEEERFYLELLHDFCAAQRRVGVTTHFGGREHDERLLAALHEWRKAEETAELDAKAGLSPPSPQRLV